MPEKVVRDIGAEILEGLRELKRGEVGRVLAFPLLVIAHKNPRALLDAVQ